jgi:hypothetical protein
VYNLLIIKEFAFMIMVNNNFVFSLRKELTMEDELFKQLYQLVPRIANGQTLKRATYNDAVIVLTYLWAVLHDRPMCWACQKKNWPLPYRRYPLPDNSTLSRRLRTAGVQRLLGQVEKELVHTSSASSCRWIDAKPLTIGRSSKDKQSGYGYADGGMGKGYKLHAVADVSQGFVNWTIRPMNDHESRVARDLIPQISSGDYLIGDGSYDKNHLYDLAGRCGFQLLAPQRIHNAKGIGHRRHSPYRLRNLSLQQEPLGQILLSSRTHIERMFGQLTNLGCGLSPLPNWVRTYFRVEMWVRGKMIIYHLWRLKNHENVA